MELGKQGGIQIKSIKNMEAMTLSIPEHDELLMSKIKEK